MTNPSFPRDANLGGMDAPDTLDDLLLRLTADDPYVRTWAAIDLRKRNDPRAIPALFEAVTDPDWDVREEVMTALEVIIPADDVPNLFRLACLPKENGDNSDPTSYAMQAYKKLRMRWEEALTYLAALLTDPDITVRHLICTNFFDHIALIFNPYYYQDCGETDASEITRRVIETLLPVLRNGLLDVSAIVRAACAEALRIKPFQQQSTVQELLPLLRDTETCVRRAATRTIMHFPRSLADLRPYLHDARAATRAAAIDALPLELDEEGIDALIVGSQDAATEVRLAVLARIDGLMYTLHFGRKSTLLSDLRLIRVLQKALLDNWPDVRESAANLISKYLQQSMTAQYIEALLSDDESARRTALRVLPEFNLSRIFHRLIEVYDETAVEGRLAITTLAGLVVDREYTRRIMLAISRALTDPDGNVRCSAVAAADQVAGTEMLEKIKALTADPDATVAAAARQAMQQIEERLTFSALVAAYYDSPSWKRRKVVRMIKDSPDPRRTELLCTAFSDADVAVRIEAYTLAWEVFDERVRYILLHLVQNDPDPFNRSMAIGALARNKVRELIPLLIPMLREKSYHVRRQAFSALPELTGQHFDEDITAWEQWWASQQK